MKLDDITPGDVLYVSGYAPTDEPWLFPGIPGLARTSRRSTVREIVERRGGRPGQHAAVTVVATRAPYKNGMRGVLVRLDFDATTRGAPCVCSCGDRHFPPDAERRTEPTSVEFTVHHTQIMAFAEVVERELPLERIRQQHSGGGDAR